jgi:hypothetical protein
MAKKPARYSVDHIINHMNKRYDSDYIIHEDFTNDIIHRWDYDNVKILILHLIKTNRIDALTEMIGDFCGYTKINLLRILIKFTAKYNIKIIYIDMNIMLRIAYGWVKEFTLLKYMYNIHIIKPDIPIYEEPDMDYYSKILNLNNKIFI